MKNVLITGVSSGIGSQIVNKFCQLPNYNIIGFSRNKSKLKQLKLNCEIHAKSNLILEQMDINSLTKTKLNKIFSDNKIKNLEILINNAGHLINKPFLKLNAKDWNVIYNTNVFSLANMIKLCHPYLKKGKSPHVVNISSMGGIPLTDKFPGLTAYSSSKAAVGILSEVLAVEFKKDNIACNCLALGAVQTPMLKKAFPGFKADVQPLEMANFVVDFALNSHHFINGKVVPVAKLGV